MLLTIVLIPVMGFAHDAAAAQAKTSPPPSSFLAPNTIFHPDFNFLEKGQGYLSYQGDNKVNIWLFDVSNKTRREWLYEIPVYL